MSYFTDEAPEVRELIEKCANQRCPELRADYLINCLTPKYRQNMTVKEIFEAEWAEMQKLEAELNERKAEINA
jgi:hypothetical protein